MQSGFDARHEILDDRTHQYVLMQGAEVLAYDHVLRLWQHEEAFRGFFTSLLSASPFIAYRWETPPVTNDTVNRRFEFVLVDSPGLVRSGDTTAFAEHFKETDVDQIAVVNNLGKDAKLVVPPLVMPDSSYVHLADFIRSAPDTQLNMFWRTVGQAVQRNITDQPLWLSTAGAGIAWLHVRLDSTPKY